MNKLPPRGRRGEPFQVEALANAIAWTQERTKHLTANMGEKSEVEERKS